MEWESVVVLMVGVTFTGGALAAVPIAYNGWARRRANVPGPGHHLVRGSDMPKGTCSVDGCEEPHNARGFCAMHYQRLKRRGQMEPLQTRTNADRFWAHVDTGGPGGCWLWTGHVIWSGYGHFSVKSRPVKAHRFAYEMLVGPIPDDLQLDHLCRVPCCVNPAHLEPVTARENTLRSGGTSAVNARKTHCIHGHEFTAENTYLYEIKASGRVGRGCKACRVESNRRFVARRGVSV